MMVKRIMAISLGLGLIGSLVLSTVGCTEIPIVKPAPRPESPSASNQQFDDIPVPMNFKHIPKESVVYQNAQVRTASIKYLGNARLDKVMNFYIHQMQALGWSYVGLFGAEEKTLAFEKDKERCEVIIKDSASETWLTININYGE